MAKIIKTGGNPQKVVFTMLAAILLLEFGSLTKLQKVWGLAFNAPATSTPTSTTTSSNPTVTLMQPTHPVTNNNPVVTL